MALLGAEKNKEAAAENSKEVVAVKKVDRTTEEILARFSALSITPQTTEQSAWVFKGTAKTNYHKALSAELARAEWKLQIDDVITSLSHKYVVFVEQTKDRQDISLEGALANLEASFTDREKAFLAHPAFKRPSDAEVANDAGSHQVVSKFKTEETSQKYKYQQHPFARKLIDNVPNYLEMFRKERTTLEAAHLQTVVGAVAASLEQKYIKFTRDAAKIEGNLQQALPEFENSLSDLEKRFRAHAAFQKTSQGELSEVSDLKVTSNVIRAEEWEPTISNVVTASFERFRSAEDARMSQANKPLQDVKDLITERKARMST